MAQRVRYGGRAKTEPSYPGLVEAHQSVHSDNQRLKPLWLGFCLVLGVGLGLWSLYLIGLVVLLTISVAVALNQRSQRVARATLIALTLGYEAGLATLIALYAFAWGELPTGGYLYLGILAAAGPVIELPILWWRERHVVRPERGMWHR
jgi:hypothetical protein